MLNKVLGERQFIIVGPFLGKLGDRIPVQSAGQTPHHQLRQRRGSLFGRQSLESFLNLRILIHLVDVAENLQPLTLLGQAKA